MLRSRLDVPSTDHAWTWRVVAGAAHVRWKDRRDGHTIAVHFFVPLLGVAPGLPANGAALGSYRGKVQTAYSDAMAIDVISTLSDFVFSHTFTAEEAQDVAKSGLFLRMYAFGYDISGEVDGPVGARLYLDKVTWS